MGALDNLLVLETAQGLAGPFCGQFMAEAGARVIKVEPVSGDHARGWGPPFVGDDSAVFTAVNRGKESITLDLESEEGQDVLYRLAGIAAVVVENPVPGETGGSIGYQELGRSYPELVLCSISDFSEEGPLKDIPGAELVYQGMSDYFNSLGTLGEAPIRVGADIAELGTGLFAYIGVLAALYHRTAAGEGQQVHINKSQTLMLMRNVIWSAISNPDEWYGIHCENYFYPPEHGVSTAGDPIYFMMRSGGEDLFDRLIIRLGMERVASDPRFAEGGREAMGLGRYAAEVKGIWEEAFKHIDTDEVLSLIRDHGGEAAPYMDYPTLASHPQIEAMKVFQQVEYPGHGTVRAVGVPWEFSSGANAVLGRAPHLGEHTDAILSLLGYAPEHAQTLRMKGATGSLH